MIVKFTFFLFSNITLIIYLAFLLAFLFFFMLTYIFLKCNTFLFISQFFYNPIPISLFSDILFVKNLSLHFPIFHVFYLFFVQYIQKRQNTILWYPAAVLPSAPIENPAPQAALTASSGTLWMASAITSTACLPPSVSM